jgi:FAD/FMN-containing dehydrogenase
LGALRCRSADTLSRAMAILHRERIAMVPRGGGMSYTGGYVPARARSVIIDTSVMNRIIEISAENMLISVEAGVTWKAIHEALKPLGLRLPFFGTFSGAKATVGGGLSNGKRSLRDGHGLHVRSGGHAGGRHAGAHRAIRI